MAKKLTSPPALTHAAKTAAKARMVAETRQYVVVMTYKGFQIANNSGSSLYHVVGHERYNSNSIQTVQGLINTHLAK